MYVRLDHTVILSYPLSVFSYTSIVPATVPSPCPLSYQTFRARLPEIIDQAQHFASIHATGGGRGGDAAIAAFREGMDGTERECTYHIMLLVASWAHCVISGSIPAGTG